LAKKLKVIHNILNVNGIIPFHVAGVLGIFEIEKKLFSFIFFHVQLFFPILFNNTSHLLLKVIYKRSFQKKSITGLN